MLKSVVMMVVVSVSFVANAAPCGQPNVQLGVEYGWDRISLYGPIGYKMGVCDKIGDYGLGLTVMDCDRLASERGYRCSQMGFLYNESRGYRSANSCFGCL